MVNIESLEHQYEMAVKLMEVDKSELLTVDNPRYEEALDQYPHLKEVTITEHDKKPHLPVHIVLVSSEYARIEFSNNGDAILNFEHIAMHCGLSRVI